MTARFFASALAILCLSVSFAAFAADDLPGVVRETLDHNPELQASWSAFRAARHDEREAFGGYLPSLDVSASAGRGEREFDNRGSYDRHYAEISLTQMLFDGFLVRSQLDRAAHTRKARYYDLQAEAQGKALEAAQAYLDVLRYRETVQLARRNLQDHRLVYRQVEERAQRGVGNRADLRQISGRLALAEANLATEVANLHDVTARFMRIVGRLPADTMQPALPLASQVPDRLTAALAEAYSNNPTLYSAAENIEAFEAAHRERRAGRYPRLELGVRHGLYKNNNSFDERLDPDPYGGETLIELRLRYNLYRGGSDMAAERAARERIGQAESLLDKACVDLRQSASIAYNDVVNLSRKLDSLAAHRDGARDVRVAYREQFDIGRRSLLDVLDSENEAFQAERAYVHGRYDLIGARYRTVHAMGQLLPALNLAADDFPRLADLNAGPGPRLCTVHEAGAWDSRRLLEVEEPPVPAATESIELSGDTLFDVGSARLRDTSGLARLARELSALDGVKEILIIGHTDSTGSAALNRRLSLARAAAARDYLLAAGLDQALIRAVGVGADRPVANNATAAGRAANRRVEIQVVREAP